MKQLLLSTLFLLSLSSSLFAQDAIYTANGNRLDNAQLTGLTDDKVTFTVRKPDKISTHSFQRQNILIAFSRVGNFLIINDLSKDLALAQQQLQTFLSATARQTNKDFLVKAVPLAVIPATISYESDIVINYKTQDGKAASIPKSELVAVLYHDGRHTLLRGAAEVAPLLNDVKTLINADPSPVITQPTAVVPSPAPLIEPTNPVSTSLASAPLPTVEVQPKTVQNQLAAIPSVTESGKPILNEADYQVYRKKALQKVDEFVAYLNIITDKKLTTYEKDKAIAQASSLFMPAATIEVTSANRPGSRRYPIRDYLTRLKLLPYSSAKIEWSEVQYIKELSQAADGNYYGVITGQQTFAGYGNHSDVVYSDVVQKNVRVKLSSYGTTTDGIKNLKWDVLLGSIGGSSPINYEGFMQSITNRSVPI